MEKLRLDKAMALKIIVPALVAVLVLGVFVLKKARSPMPPTSVSTDGSAKETLNITSFADIGLSELHVATPIDYAALRSSGLPVVIDFGADTCIPCKEMAPVLAELNKELAGRAIIKFVDVWKYKNLSEGIPIQVIPTQVFFDSSGKAFTPHAELQIPFNMYSNRDTKEHVFTTHEGGLDKNQLLTILKNMGMKD